MALIPCKECGFKISDKAQTCVHCGGPVAAAAAPAAAPPPSAAPKKKAKPWPLWAALFIAFGVLVFGLINALGKEFEDMIAPAPQKAQAPAPATSAILVSAVNLSKDYRTSEASADMNYKGESLLVNGVIDAIHKTPIDAPSVILSGGASFKAVHAQFPKIALNKLSTLKRGQTITVACTGGGTVSGSPILKGCTLFKS